MTYVYNLIWAQIQNLWSILSTFKISGNISYLQFCFSILIISAILGALLNLVRNKKEDI